MAERRGNRLQIYLHRFKSGTGVLINIACWPQVFQILWRRAFNPECVKSDIDYYGRFFHWLGYFADDKEKRVRFPYCPLRNKSTEMSTMKKDYTFLAIIVDRSGSMINMQNEAENAINRFINDQKTNNECSLFLVTFDDQIEANYYEDINSFEEFVLVPRGTTALYDAIGHTVNEIGISLERRSEFERPDSVIVVIMTDGFENASQTFNKAGIKNLIQQQTNDYNWKFIFLGANQDAVLVGQTIGISADSSLTYAKPDAALRSVSNYVTMTRGGLEATFNEDDRSAAV